MAAALMQTHFDPIKYVVPGYVTEGLTIFAGAPKIGKSWMTLAVASGRPAFGSIPVDQGDVLYLALENNPRRLKRRMHKMGVAIAPDRLTLCTEWPGLDDGCVDEVAEWIGAVEKPMLVVIDVLSKVRPSDGGKDSAHDAEYKTLTGLHALALAERGDLGGMSFGFVCPKGGDSWAGERRTLHAVDLHEVSVVSAWPAYPDTSLALRSRGADPAAGRRRRLVMAELGP